MSSTKSDFGSRLMWPQQPTLCYVFRQVPSDARKVEELVSRIQALRKENAILRSDEGFTREGMEADPGHEWITKVAEANEETAKAQHEVDRMKEAVRQLEMQLLDHQKYTVLLEMQLKGVGKEADG